MPVTFNAEVVSYQIMPGTCQIRNQMWRVMCSMEHVIEYPICSANSVNLSRLNQLGHNIGLEIQLGDYNL